MAIPVTFEEINRNYVEVFVRTGRFSSPSVVITAGIHGTEVAGVVAAQALRQIEIVRGTLIVMPLVNRKAYQERTRGTPDINRTFPKSPTGHAKHVISRRVFHVVRQYRPAWCIDLHETNRFYRVNHTKLGQTLIAYPNRTTVRTARIVADKVNRSIGTEKMKFSVRSGKLSGSFRTAAGQLVGTHALTVETSMQQPRALRVRYQMLVVRTLLEEIGML